MAARYCLVAFHFHNAVSGHDEYVSLGALRDSAHQAAVQYPAMFGTVQPTTLTGLDPKLAEYLKVHPGGPGE